MGFPRALKIPYGRRQPSTSYAASMIRQTWRRSGWNHARSYKTPERLIFSVLAGWMLMTSDLSCVRWGCVAGLLEVHSSSVGDSLRGRICSEGMRQWGENKASRFDPEQESSPERASKDCLFILTFCLSVVCQELAICKIDGCPSCASPCVLCWSLQGLLLTQILHKLAQ